MDEKTLSEAIDARNVILNSKLFMRYLKKAVDDEKSVWIDANGICQLELYKEDIEQLIEILQHRVDNKSALLESL